MTPSLFEEIVAFETNKSVHESLYNDAAFGKLAMATLTLEVTFKKRKVFSVAIV